jgi:hypothetical protein
VHVDLQDPPTVVRLPDPNRTTVSLDWDRALDDEQHLRHCPVCGCEDLYARKQVPQVTIFALLILAALAAIVIFGLGEAIWALIALALILGLDLAIFYFAKRIMVCYDCLSEFRGMPIRRDQPAWDPAVAERYRVSEMETERPSSD